jgi:D-alanyl-D-alanine carboxypeptidase
MHHIKGLRVYASIITIVLVGGAVYGAYVFITNSKALKTAYQENVLSKEKILALEKQNQDLGGTLSLTQTEKAKLGNDLEDEQKRSKRLEARADKYKKLALTDKQLLAKYSKVYFLNENYSPTKLDDIEDKYVLPAGKKIQFLDPALPYLEDLLDDADEAGVNLRVVSAYRSFDEQMALKSNYKFIYGAGTANTFSADQGYSEHQLGTTVDFGTPSVPGAMPAFEKTTAYKWLLENAHEYGFVISYPKANSYYMYEPWHWRFLGEDLAGDLHDDKKSFYDLDQRDIDDYLIKIFD